MARGRPHWMESELLEAAIAARRAQMTGMPRRAADMLLHLMPHDAHHRGQIVVLGKDLGHEFKGEDITWLWGWRALPENLPGGARLAGRVDTRPSRAPCRSGPPSFV